MKVIVRGTCDKDIALEAKRVAKAREISFSGLLERALAFYLKELKREGENNDEIRDRKDLRRA